MATRTTPPVSDPIWSTVRPNDIGTDEFMTLCRLTSIEPYITAVRLPAQRRFAPLPSTSSTRTAQASTPWGAKRAATAIPEPYRVRLWNIGDEM